MRRSKAWKWLIIGCALTIVALYMLEMTTLGIERVYGPLQQNQASTAAASNENQQQLGLLPIEESVQPLEHIVEEKEKAPSGNNKIDQEIAQLEAEIAELKRLALIKEKEQLQQQLLINENADKPAVNVMADSTSQALQKASSSGLQFIAQMFSKVID